MFILIQNLLILINMCRGGEGGEEHHFVKMII